MDTSIIHDSLLTYLGIINMQITSHRNAPDDAESNTVPARSNG